ncbi:glycosyltransferase [Streptococcus uberis]|nr:glycosyltransferase [Streptococcus uberis]
MAVFNGAKYIDQQIQSIIPQLKLDDELVISYDLSTDSTLDIIKSYAANDSRIKIFINENPGLFNNFENALRNCKNDYIFISDQDDIWKKNKCQLILSKFESENVDMLIHNGIHFNEVTKEISEDFFTIYGIKKGLINNFLKPRYSGCCMAFKKELLTKMLPIPATIGGYDHWLGMIGEVYGNLLFIDDVLIEHRLHNSNFTPTSRRSLSEIAKARTSLIIELAKRKNK